MSDADTDVALWRIAATTRHYRADDLSGAGAARSPGRWNAVNEHVLYAAPDPAVAVLETAAHLTTGALPLDRYLVRIDVPAASWAARTCHAADALPPDWDAIPGSLSAVRVGSGWYASNASLLLDVPSATLPEVRVLVINCRHPDAAALRCTVLRRYDYLRVFRPA